jgi:hypothetical protein
MLVAATQYLVATYAVEVRPLWVFELLSRDEHVIRISFTTQ